MVEEGEDEEEEEEDAAEDAAKVGSLSSEKKRVEDDVSVGCSLAVVLLILSAFCFLAGALCYCCCCLLLLHWSCVCVWMTALVAVSPPLQAAPLVCAVSLCASIVWPAPASSAVVSSYAPLCVDERSADLVQVRVPRLECVDEDERRRRTRMDGWLCGCRGESLESHPELTSAWQQERACWIV